MRLRSLLPWLLAGALLPSVFANISLYRDRGGPASAHKSSAAVGSGGVSAAHLDPGSSNAHCPTLDRLGLTEKQRDRIQRCSLTSLKVRTDLAVEIHSASAELDALMSADAVDGARILELADRVSGLRARQYKAWIGSILVIRDVLTPEQLKQLHRLESE